MKALRLKAFGGTEVLEIADVPAPPAPRDDQIIVRVRAAGVNRADTLQRRGRYPAPPGSPPDILGMEFAGEVSAVGPGVRDLRVGDRVMGLVGGGAQAEFVATREPLVLPVPDAVTDIEAGGIPEAYITAHDALFSHASLVQGERVLIHAVGSSVGLAAVQLAKAIGAVTYGSTRSAVKAARAQEIGLDHVVDPKSLEFPNVDVVIDFVGADYLQRNVACLATLGRLVFVSTLSGPRADLDISMLMRKRLRLAGTMMRNRDDNEKARATKAFGAMLPFFADRRIVMPIDRVLPLEQAAAAHAAIEANENFGKIVLTL
ncbi:MAG TPA: NAD(P)H-quinone oxidoreductase [Candidatus Eremiobacteraceae bacterium]|nr:NAD(P)H-quinone oxidoreductase [Candidatus Eremiobacteraceae bacterium]